MLLLSAVAPDFDSAVVAVAAAFVAAVVGCCTTIGFMMKKDQGYRFYGESSIRVVRWGLWVNVFRCSFMRHSVILISVLIMHDQNALP
jgi:hypothetical protein